MRKLLSKLNSKLSLVDKCIVGLLVLLAFCILYSAAVKNRTMKEQSKLDEQAISNDLASLPSSSEAIPEHSSVEPMTIVVSGQPTVNTHQEFPDLPPTNSFAQMQEVHRHILEVHNRIKQQEQSGNQQQ